METTRFIYGEDQGGGQAPPVWGPEVDYTTDHGQTRSNYFFDPDERDRRKLRHLESEIERSYRASTLTEGAVGLRNVVHTAMMVAMAAWRDKTSTAGHYDVGQISGDS
jgi:hypothetical protein